MNSDHFGYTAELEPNAQQLIEQIVDFQIGADQAEPNLHHIEEAEIDTRVKEAIVGQAALSILDAREGFSPYAADSREEMIESMAKRVILNASFVNALTQPDQEIRQQKLVETRENAIAAGNIIFASTVAEVISRDREEPLDLTIDEPAKNIEESDTPEEIPTEPYIASVDEILDIVNEANELLNPRDTHLLLITAREEAIRSGRIDLAAYIAQQIADLGDEE